MSLSTITSTKSIKDLAAEITRNLDTNKDGQLSTDEFANFLTSLLGTLEKNGSAATAGAAAKATAEDRVIVSHVAEPIGAERLANPNPKSPKDLFLSRAQYYRYNELPQLLTDLQNDPIAGKYYTGFTSIGDKLIPPANRQNGVNGWGNEWGDANYADPIDVILAYNAADGTAQGWRWGVEGRSATNPGIGVNA